METNMKRRPHQQYYRPGSGALRKSTSGIEECESDSNLIINSKQHQSKNSSYVDSNFKSEGNSPRNNFHNMNKTVEGLEHMTLRDAPRKAKKPDLELYVPRSVAQSKKFEQDSYSNPSTALKRREFSEDDKMVIDDQYFQGLANGNDKHEFQSYNRLSNNRNKRYPNRNRGNDSRDSREENWNDKSNTTRQMKQGSEPRSHMNYSRDSSNWSRMRDTRSVEPTLNSSTNSNYADKLYPAKPPSGRRHSTIGMERLNEIPPRFRKKMMEEGKLKNVNLPEEGWDGNSLTFQGAAVPKHNYSANHSNQSTPGSYATLPNSHMLQNQNEHNMGYSTLPSRTRGRGRLNYNNYDYGSIGRQVDVISPCNSRPPTPPYYGSFRDNEYSGKSSSRPSTPSYNRKNEYKTNSDEKYNSSSRHSSQERNRRHNYNDNYHSRNSENRFLQCRSGDRYSDGNKEDFYQRGRGEQRPSRTQGDHQDHRSRQGYRTGESNSKSFVKRNDYRNSEEPSRDEIKNVKHISYPGRSTVGLGIDCAQKTSDQIETQIENFVEPSNEPSENLIENTIRDVLDWSEEVELNYKMESGTLSDVPTRSSSVTSLVESNSTLVPSQSSSNLNSIRKSKRKNKKKNRRRGRSRSGTRDRSKEKHNEEYSHGFDNFKVPAEPRNGRSSRDRRDSSFDRFSRSSRAQSRECSFDRMRRVSSSEPENWRNEMKVRQEQEKGREITRSRKSSDDTSKSADTAENSNCKRQSLNDFSNIDMKKAGVLIIQPNHELVMSSTPPSLDHPRYAEARQHTMDSRMKSLFDPNNPDKPIIVKSSNARVAPGIPDNTEITPPPAVIDQFGNVCPSWYREGSEENGQSRYPAMIRDVKRADQEIQYAIHSGIFLKNWSVVETFRQFLREALQYFLCKDLKFSQTGNIENHFWKLLYYNIIERIRKAILDDEENKEHYKKFVLYLVDEGTQYFENLLKVLEETYQFDLNDYLGMNHAVPQKGLGYIGLALISAQKIFIFLGDLARYKEQINENTNYGKCRQWYIRAHEINPKNGKPYKQLAVLAVCARRKLDAVYYFMRSLMSSNPIYSVREKMTTLLYENSKKYEQGEKKRMEERLERARNHMKEKENDPAVMPTSVRKETWIRPDGGKRVHRTTQAVLDDDSEEENLSSLSSVEVNKRFVISYLHVHGKLITRIGMESFQEAAMQMLKEFRALLQHSPLPIPSNRLLQLLALNMYAIECTQLKDPELQLSSGYRSESQERALVVSLQMFNLILERCVSLLEEHLASKPNNINAVSMDAHVLLPPIKIWCDWMLCHSGVWNPPPSTQDFRVGAPVDAWTRFAMLINLLSQLDQSTSSIFSNEPLEGYEQLRLPEDNVLSGFTPLMLNLDEPTYIPKNYDVESAQFVLRLNKLLFFGTEFLCGLEPPVLKLEIDNDFQEYVSVVSNSNSRDSPQCVTNMRLNDEVLMESFSEDEQTLGSLSEDTSSEVKDLLNRKVELEKTHKSQERHLERVKKILSQSVVSVHIEILPKYLVPDTNCFIDHLDRISNIVNAPSSPYTIMVPIVVLGELEGLSRGGISPIPGTRSCLDPDHVKKVGECARKALNFLKNRHSNLKSVTTKGAVCNSTTFTTEDDSTSNCVSKNDDKILTTCLNLSKTHGKESINPEGEPRQLFREVVLLTDDRNLRVKALSTDVPVRELPDFMKWAGIG